MGGGFVLGVVLLLAAVAELVGKAAAATYVVGDNQGWNVLSSVNDYSSWASRHVFRPGDVLMFNFVTGEHDVAEVRKAAHDECGSNDPIVLSTVAPWNTTLNSTGEHYYICTVGRHCSLGQKLAINVTAPSPPPPPPPPPPMLPTPTPAPAFTPTPMSRSPSPTPSSTPTPTPVSGSPTPVSGSPSSTPSPAPMPRSPGGSPLPGTPGGAPTTPGGLSRPPPGNSATLPTVSATLVVLVSVAFGLIM